ncbi:MAG: Smr/MutS family protein [Legionella sp.]|nr:Smr/MutS family protein [Legionella sp.]
MADISDEDKELFRAYVNGLSPKDGKSRSSNPVHKQYYLSDYIKEQVYAETLLSYSTPGLPSKQFQALKTGKIPWEARLDMHGLNSEHARSALCDFIEQQSHQNKRCLLIIHGKGGLKGEAPLIKNLVNRWLPQFDELLAFHSAQAKDGGQGAVYVLLKRNRNNEYLR